MDSFCFGLGLLSSGEITEQSPSGQSLNDATRIFSRAHSESQAEIVRMIFNWYVKGDHGRMMSLFTISKRLTEMGIPRPGESKSISWKLGMKKTRQEQYLERQRLEYGNRPQNNHQRDLQRCVSLWEVYRLSWQRRKETAKRAYSC